MDRFVHIAMAKSIAIPVPCGTGRQTRSSVDGKEQGFSVSFVRRVKTMMDLAE